MEVAHTSCSLNTQAHVAQPRTTTHAHAHILELTDLSSLATLLLRLVDLSALIFFFYVSSLLLHFLSGDGPGVAPPPLATPPPWSR